MIFHHKTFDELKSHPDLTYIPRSRVLAAQIESDGLILNDTGDDLIILDNAIIVDRGGVIWKDNWISDTIHYMPPDWKDVPWLPGIYNKADKTIDIYEECIRETGNIEYPVLWVDSFPANHNFGHFVHDTLPYGIVFQRSRMLEPQIRPLLVPMNFRNQRSLFSVVFDYPYEQCTFSQAGYRFKKLYLARRQTDMTSANWTLSFSGIRHARNVAQNKWGVQGLTSDYNDSLYDVYLHRIQNIDELRSRGLLLGRDFSNFNEMLNGLLKVGFLALDPGSLDINIVANMMSRAKTVVSVHGAGLANLIFCRKEARIFEIRGKGGAWRSLEALSAVLGNEFIVLDETMVDKLNRPFLDIGNIISRVS